MSKPRKAKRSAILRNFNDLKTDVLKHIEYYDEPEKTIRFFEEKIKKLSKNK